MKSTIQKVIISIILLALTGCTDAVCLDADDFGFSQVKVPANYSSSSIHGSTMSQYADWYDSGLTLSGNDIHVVVKNWDMLKNINSADELSAWCPWLGPALSPPSLQDICMMLDTCTFHDSSNMCENNPNSTGDAYILNAPCLLRKGVGLYIMAAPYDFNPNASQPSNRTPQLDPTYGDSGTGAIIVKHLGEPTTDSYGNVVTLYDLQIDPQHSGSSYNTAGGAYINVSPAQAVSLTGGKLWFKILDKYYNDNSGQYIVTVKSGVTSLEWDPTSFATDLVKNFFFGTQATGDTTMALAGDGIIVKLFNSVINQPGYQLAVTALLTIAIIYYAISFLVGNVKMTQHDLMMRVVKIIIVAQLLKADTAWNFFNHYLFGFFIQGSQSLINLIEQAGGSGPGPASIISFMLAPHTLIKLSALPMLNWSAFGWSIIYVLIYIFALAMIFFGLFYAAVIYILCLTMMGLLIALAPIFLCFMLFEPTRSLFDNWLKQLMSYALQPLIVIAGVTMFGLMIRHQIYQTLGFRVCKYYWMNIDGHTDNALSANIRGTSDRTSMPYYWVPEYAVPPGDALTEILIPEAHYQDVDGNQLGGYLSITDPNASYCQPYACAANRYLSFPFLNPNDAGDMNLLTNYWAGNFAPASSIVILILSGLLITRFNLAATKIAQYITGGGHNIASSASAVGKQLGSGAASVAKGGMKAASKTAKGIANAPGNIKKARAKIQGGIKGAKEKLGKGKEYAKEKGKELEEMAGERGQKLKKKAIETGQELNEKGQKMSNEAIDSFKKFKGKLKGKGGDMKGKKSPLSSTPPAHEGQAEEFKMSENPMFKKGAPPTNKGGSGSES